MRKKLLNVFPHLSQFLQNPYKRTAFLQSFEPKLIEAVQANRAAYQRFKNIEKAKAWENISKHDELDMFEEDSMKAAWNKMYRDYKNFKLKHAPECAHAEKLSFLDDYLLDNSATHSSGFQSPARKRQCTSTEAEVFENMERSLLSNLQLVFEKRGHTIAMKAGNAACAVFNSYLENVGPLNELPESDDDDGGEGKVIKWLESVE